MNWQKISIWIINGVMVVSMIALIFSVITVTQISQKGDNGWVEIGKLRLEDVNKYIPDENLQLKIKNPDLTHSRLRITHASLYISGADVNINWSAMYFIIRIGLFLFSLYLVREIIRSADYPFVMSNVKRLKIIGALLILGGFIEKFESIVGQWFVRRSYDLVGLEIQSEADINLSFIIGGLFMIVVAQVFKQGIKIREEQELTV